MAETATLYDTAPALPQVPQKLKVTFSDDQERMLQLDYNGLQQSFRIRLQTAQRLFFFEELLQKTVFRNEYGVHMGQVAPAKTGTGEVYADGKQYRFALADSGTKLMLLHPRSGAAISTCTLPDEVFAGSQDAAQKQRLIHCLVFSFAWALG